MHEVGLLHLSIKDLVMGFVPYREHQVDRKTTWIYYAGKPVYELINPAGQVFVLQSYSIESTPQTEATLSDLGSKLKLPKGWVFHTVVLTDQGSVVAVNEHAIVIQDDFHNTYQLASYDLLKAIDRRPRCPLKP